MHHPRRRNVTISMFIEIHYIRKNLTQTDEPEIYSWGTQKKKITAGKEGTFLFYRRAVVAQHTEIRTAIKLPARRGIKSSASNHHSNKAAGVISTLLPHACKGQECCVQCCPSGLLSLDRTAVARRARMRLSLQWTWSV